MKQILREAGVSITKEELLLDVKPLIRIVMSRFFGDATGFVDMITEHIVSPLVGAERKVVWSDLLETNTFRSNTHSLVL